MDAARQIELYSIDDIYNLPDGQRAELIDGELYMMAAPDRIHQRLVMVLSNSIFNYIQDKNGDCEVYPSPFAVFLSGDDRIYLEPDISVICDKNKLTDHGCKGAPDLTLEILSPSNACHDLLVKLNLYQRAGVREYWIVDPENKAVQVFLQDGGGSLKIHEDYGREDVAKVNVLSGCFVELSKVFSE